MEVIGLIFNFLGSIFLICANPKLEYNEKLKAMIIAPKTRKWWYWGVSFLIIGFLFQLIEKIP